MNRRWHGRLRRAQGLGLVELLMAMVIGLAVVLAVTVTYLQTASGTRHAILQAQMNEDGAIALELLASHLRLSGYSETGTGGIRLFKGLPLKGCDGGFTAATDSASFDLLACTGGSGSDAIAVRYHATRLNSPVVNSSGSPNNPLPANCVNEGIRDIDTGGGQMASIADNRFYVQNDATNDDTPTLFCRGSNGAGFSNAVALVPNVESLQLRYAVTRVPVLGAIPPHQVTALVPASDASLTPPMGDWTRVAAVELCVLVRSQRPAPHNELSNKDISRYLDCGGTAMSANDGRLRRAYRTVVHLANLRPAQAMPFETDGTTARNPYRNLDPQ